MTRLYTLLFLIACFVFTNNIAFAQTNTFPTTGNVGIGTTNPQKLLFVNGDATTNGTHHFKSIQFTNTVTGDITQPRGQLFYGQYLPNTTLYGMILDYGAIPEGFKRFYFKGTEGVFINNDNPQGYSVLRLNAKDHLPEGGALRYMGESYPGGGAYAPSATALVGFGGGGLSLTAQHALGKISFYTGGTDAPNERLRITPTGNVGIGTSDPSAQLHLADIYSAGGKNLLIGDDIYLSDIDLGNTLGIYGNQDPSKASIVLGSNGPRLYGTNQNLGIGHTNPSTKLFIATPFDGLIWNTTFANEYHTQQGRPGVGIKFKLGDGSESWKWAGISAISSSEWENYIDMVFYTPQGDGTNPERMRILSNGNIAIGRKTATAKLDVAGTIRATEIKVEAQTADFVFDDNYALRDLKEVELFISQHKHLPDIPSAAQMEADGVNLAEMNKLLLQKIEELTLYVIELESANEKEKMARESIETRLSQIELLLNQYKR